MTSCKLHNFSDCWGLAVWGLLQPCVVDFTVETSSSFRMIQICNSAQSLKLLHLYKLIKIIREKNRKLQNYWSSFPSALLALKLWPVNCYLLKYTQLALIQQMSQWKSQSCILLTHTYCLNDWLLVREVQKITHRLILIILYLQTERCFVGLMCPLYGSQERPCMQLSF